MLTFITIRFLDILDIVLVAILLYQLYRLIKGTVAFNIVIGMFSLYLLWLVVRAFARSTFLVRADQSIGLSRSGSILVATA